MSGEQRLFVCGARAVIHGSRPGLFRVVCATCDGGGTVEHHPYTAATKAAVRDSNKPCPVGCGAR